MVGSHLVEYYTAMKRDALQRSQHSEPQKKNVEQKKAGHRSVPTVCFLLQKSQKQETQNILFRNTYMLERHKKFLTSYRALISSKRTKEGEIR